MFCYFCIDMEDQQYIVSARKYRPDSFGTMIGQEALTSTLKAAILSNKTAHAYLFCGPRGVGKTSTARVFAKTINCLNRTPDGEACNECESCKAFNEQRSLNIYELDAASNNTVDDIRQLIEQVQVPPQIGTKKVYIIDEVHMLSQAAFNAFLKTLEEPPEYVIFILATTEKHKILPTILSRCQIYDFKRISVPQIAEHLSHVARQENIEAETEALGIIAEKADGGMRDALSLFDRIANFGGGKVTYDAVIKGLNILDYEYYFQFVDYFIKGDFKSVLITFDMLLSKGFDAAMIINGMASFMRNLLMARAPETLHLVEKPQAVVQRFAQVAANCPPAFLFKAIETCVNCDKDYKQASDKRLLTELALMSIAALYNKELRGGQRQAQQPKAPQQKARLQQTQQAATQVQNNIQQVQTQANRQVQGNSLQPSSTNQMQAGNINTGIQQQTQLQNAQPQQTQPAQPTRTHRPLRVQNLTGKGRTRLSVHVGDRQTAENTPSYQQVESEEKVTEESLQKSWIEFSHTELTDQIHLKQTMSTCLPILLDGEKFEVQVYNDAQEAELKGIMDQLINYLRVNLKNGKLTMSIGRAKVSKEEMPMTDQERISLWREQNKAFDKLYTNLGFEQV